MGKSLKLSQKDKEDLDQLDLNERVIDLTNKFFTKRAYFNSAELFLWVYMRL